MSQLLIDVILESSPLTLEVALETFDLAWSLSPPLPAKVTYWTKGAAQRSIRELFESREKDVPIFVATVAGRWPMSLGAFNDILSESMRAPEAMRPDKAVYAAIFTRLRSELWASYEAKVATLSTQEDEKGRLKEPRTAMSMLLGRHDEVQQQKLPQGNTAPITINVDLSKLSDRSKLVEANGDIFEADFKTLETKAVPEPPKRLAASSEGLRVPLVGKLRRGAS